MFKLGIIEESLYVVLSGKYFFISLLRDDTWNIYSVRQENLKG